MKIKPVFTWSPAERKVRLFRVIWEREALAVIHYTTLEERDIKSRSYSAMVSFSLVPRIFKTVPMLSGFDVTVLGVRVHHQRSYGGRFV